MPIPSRYRERITRSIGTILLEEQDLKKVVLDATGNDPFVVYTTKEKPRAEQIDDILARLERDGIERWLLIFVLVMAHWDDRFRQLILMACPSTLNSSIPLDEQVSALTQNLEKVLMIPLSAAIKDGLLPKRTEFSNVLHQIEALLSYRSLYERLHLIQARLDRELVLDANSVRLIVEACRQARDVAIPLGPDEVNSIAELERLASDASRALDAGNTDSALASLISMERPVRLFLSGVNGQIFALANALSLRFLIEEIPPELEELFDPLQFPIRNVIPTVLARVLVRKVWQESSNEIALIGNLLDAGMAKSTEFNEHWRTLKSRVHWLAELELNTEWSKGIDACAAAIDDVLAVEKSSVNVEPKFEAYRRAFERGFPSIMLKLDFGSVAEINPKLQAVLQDISHA
jgi:hypothetical protein